MNDPSPYQPPLPQGPTSIPPELLGEPAAVKVFGVLHLVFAGLGIISAVWGLFIAVIGNPFLKLTAANPEMSRHLDAQLAMQAKINPMSITAAILSMIVAIPMIIAGIQLLKRRKNALMSSNTYAWSSLGAKLINLVLTVTILVPAMQEMTRGITGGAPMPAGFPGIMSGFMAGAAIGGVLVSSIYPILTLVLLNPAAVKAWFASVPK